MNKFYNLNVAGLTRKLPICKINEKESIAAFIMFSDVELTVRCAYELSKIVPQCDMIITAESKGIPLAYELARIMNKEYIVARKHSKLYMLEPVEIEMQSVTTKGTQKLCLDKRDLNKLNKKNILIVDDVISTGNSLSALEYLIGKSEGKVAGKAAVLAEGDAIGRKDIIHLADLPIIKNF